MGLITVLLKCFWKIYGLPGWTSDCKSYEEFLEQKFHLASKTNKKIHCSDAGNPEVTPEAQLLTHLFISLQKLPSTSVTVGVCQDCWLLPFCSTQPLESAHCQSQLSKGPGDLLVPSNGKARCSAEQLLKSKVLRGSCCEQANRMHEDSGSTVWIWPLISSCLHFKRLQPVIVCMY